MYLAGSLFTTMVSPIHTVLLPTMAELWNKNQRSEIGPIIEQIIRLSALITLPTLAGTMILYQPLLGMLIKGGMLPNVDYFLLICISFVVFGFGIPLGDLLMVAGKTRHLFVLNGGLAAINLILNTLLVPTLGHTRRRFFNTCLSCYLYNFCILYITTHVKLFIPWPALLKDTFSYYFNGCRTTLSHYKSPTSNYNSDSFRFPFLFDHSSKIRGYNYSGYKIHSQLDFQGISFITFAIKRHSLTTYLNSVLQK